MRHDNPRHGLGRLLAVVAEDLIGSTCSGLIFTRPLFNINCMSTTVVMISHITVISRSIIIIAILSVTLIITIITITNIVTTMIIITITTAVYGY